MSHSSSMAACLETPPPASRRVAVIGAGAAGFVVARELRREGHRAVVFERGAAIGGTWVYTAATESDPQGLDPFREIVQSSLYDSLRTNLPRECMGFLDYPFSSGHSRAGGDPRRFPGHREVLRYLEDFCRDFDLYRLIRFQTEVAAVEKVCDGRWEVRSRRDGLVEEREVFDAVVVCNGHYTEPRVAEIPGRRLYQVVCTQINSIKFSFENRQRLQSSHCIQPLNHYGGIDTWPGKQMHSHNYRLPEPFLDQMVVIIGSSSSAVDISRDIAKYAKEVHVSSRSPSTEFPKKQPGYDNMWLHSTIESTHKDGNVVFLDGSQFHVDVIIHCTGYKYHFPFLKTNNTVTVDDNCVGPLYKHVFPPSHAPSLSFIGIPWKVVPFPLFELQSKWVSGALSGRITLPTEEEMMADVEAWYLEIEAFGWPKRYSHNLSKNQFEYDGWLAAQCGHPPIEEWRKLMYESTSMNKIAQPEKYRDEWDDDHLVTQAEQTFKFL